MKIHVVFEFPDVNDVESIEADGVIEALTIDLKNIGFNKRDWYIDDVTE